MPNAIELIKIMKRAAVEAVRAEKPTEICFGKVTCVSPLKITVEPKLTLGEAQLVLTRNVTEYQTFIHRGNIQEHYYVGERRDENSLPVDPPHVHAIGNIHVTVRNGLVVGDEVVLFRQQGGQKYIVADRVG